LDDPRVKESIVRHLSTKYARPVAARPLIDEFENVTGDQSDDVKWVIGNALDVVADDTVFDDIVRLARTKRHGYARQMIVAALGNMKDTRAVAVLVELLDDEEVAGQALVGLRKLAPIEARQHVERFVDHPTTWVRNEAKKALAKIEKKQARAHG
jgi:HEAT repeat protein